MLRKNLSAFNMFSPKSKDLLTAFTHIGSSSYITEITIRRRPMSFFSAKKATKESDVSPSAMKKASTMVEKQDLYMCEMKLFECPSGPKKVYNLNLLT